MQRVREREESVRRAGRAVCGFNVLLAGFRAAVYLHALATGFLRLMQKKQHTGAMCAGICLFL